MRIPLIIGACSVIGQWGLCYYEYMSELKTTINDANVNDFLQTVPDATKKEDSLKLLQLFTRATGEQPKMWGTSIVGFGAYHYKSERSSQEGDWMLTGFSPRKQNLTIYVTNGFDNYGEMLDKLGKYKTSKGCLYIQKLADIDMSVLETLVRRVYEDMKKTYA